jgi:hypothetical protein
VLFSLQLIRRGHVDSAFLFLSLVRGHLTCRRQGISFSRRTRRGCPLIGHCPYPRSRGVRHVQVTTSMGPRLGRPWNFCPHSARLKSHSVQASYRIVGQTSPAPQKNEDGFSRPLGSPVCLVRASPPAVLTPHQPPQVAHTANRRSPSDVPCVPCVTRLTVCHLNRCRHPAQDVDCGARHRFMLSWNPNRMLAAIPLSFPPSGSCRLVPVV